MTEDTSMPGKELIISVNAITSDYVGDAVSIVESCRNQAYHVINTSLVRRNWLLGRRISIEMLKGRDRADYGKQIVEVLSNNLTDKFGRGFSKSNLYSFLKFYECFPDIFQTPSGESSVTLTWSHYQVLLNVPFDKARAWYAKEASDQMWSVRVLKRNIATQYYDRILGHQVEKTGMMKDEEDLSKLEFIKNPVIAEFLGLPHDAALEETDLETAILDNLQKFLMEMGKGFAFVARQKHIRTAWDDYFIDLVFYNYILKCFVLVDLKSGKVTHQDVGQMDMYVRMFDERMVSEGDNPTLGIILCSETDEDIARYSILHDSDHLFMAKYRTCLPSEEDLRQEIEVQKRIFQMQHEGGGE